MPSTRSSAATKCISEVPGLAKQTVTPPPTKVRTRLSAPFMSALLPLGLVARLGLGIGGVEAGQFRAALDLAHDPFLERFLLWAGGGDIGGERRGDDHGAVAVGDDDVIGKDRDAAAADGLLPADEGERRGPGGRPRTGPA